MIRKHLKHIIGVILILLLFFLTTPPKITAQSSFRFISWGDAQNYAANLLTTANQAATLNPAFTIFNGDLENEGVTQAKMNAMTTSFGTLFPKTFLVRGNHDNEITGSAALWENYLLNLGRPLPAGVTNYIALDNNSTYLTYSFDYGNSRFIGIDVPGDSDLITNSEYNFLNARLSDAENIGLTHAFIFFHGPEYCVESTHCECSVANDASCTPSSFVNIINNHPIVSATFHGHEHILGWVHMNSARISTLNQTYEEFFTSPAGGGSHNQYVYPSRLDYYYPDMQNSTLGFTSIDVNGSSFTFNIYKVGTTNPVWSRIFTKGGVPTPTPTITPTPSSSQTPFPTPKPGDANEDGLVNESDYSIWFSNYKQPHQSPSYGDFNSDGYVNGVDYVIWLINFGL